MIDKIANDARVYNDVQGLENLRYESNKNSAAVKKEVCQQFESILMQTVLRSMRDANKAFTSDLLGSDQMDMYQDMFDNQLTLTTSANLGFAKEIEKNIDAQYADKAAHPANITQEHAPQAQKPIEKTINLAPKKQALADPMAITAEKPPTESTHQPVFNSPEEFVKTLWSSAKHAAKLIGVDPKVLLAQAALETNWGKKILPHGTGLSSNNLFNIKADSGWDKQTTTTNTLEQKNGVLAKEKATFRSYESFKESFMDYVHFLKNNNRYAQALNIASNSGQFVHELQRAGYATDANYANKILKIFSSHTFQTIANKLL